jgi:hypothetical protein
VSDDISFQTWICPACHDDHAQAMGCYKKIDELEKKLAENRSKKCELWVVCERFLKDNNVECEESCYQSDKVYENSPTLIEDIFTIIKSLEEKEGGELEKQIKNLYDKIEKNQIELGKDNILKGRENETIRKNKKILRKTF